MAGINGLTAAVPIPAAPYASSGSQANGAVGPTTTLPSVIDGTPVRVVTLALAGAAGLWALHLAGFRFNLGVSA